MLSVYEDPDLPYEKGPLLPYDKPAGVEIPAEQVSPQEALPLQEEGQEEEPMEEDDVVDVDVNAIF